MRRSQIGISALVVIALITAPAVLPGTYYTYLAIIVFIYGIVAIGLNILAGYAGQLSLGHAALMAVGAYTTALLSKALASVSFFAATGLHIWLGMVVGTVAAALFGALLAIPALRVRGPYLAMVTIAFGWVIFKILQEWSSVTGGDLGISGIPKPRIASLTLTMKQYYYVVLAMFIIALTAQYRLVLSQFGLRLRAMKHSEIGVASVGVNVYHVKVAIFTLSAAFAGMGGALFAHQQNYISPDNFQFFSSVFFLLAVLFGGAGTLLGPIIGAAVLTLLPEMLHDFDTYRLIVYGVLILVTLYLLPNGIMGALAGRASKTPAGLPAEASAKVAPQWITKAGGAALEVRNISRSFGGLQALRNVSVQIASGSVHALIGPNGAGKTTLINILTGLYQADSGEVAMDGAVLHLRSLSDAALAGIARTFQTIKLFGDLAVLDHVMIGFAGHSRVGILGALVGGSRSRSEAERHAANARQLIQFVGLHLFENAPASRLAYGHRRLVEIARALAVRPKVLLLDEPAAGLALKEIEALADVIRRLRDCGVTILLVEHHMDLIVSVSDRITVLDYGEVIAEGSPAAIQNDPRVVTAYLGKSRAAA
jgi:ABC-type branched-subunit amino acid transport system ATPase component/ABC-type branched-subunit amino acid transport system permease subunit